ncbi:MAG: DivIVA domain-containing protein [candidate division Zixibacteria bacterium]|nr:DivIVA domain-containing protein [candidate division Zixibacteria bacterium]
MSFTPNEIRNHQFSSTIRGYSKEEVETFREEIATTLEETLAKIGELTEKYQRLDERFKTLSGLEDALKLAKTESDKNAQAVLEVSQSDAQKIMLAAKERGAKILEEAEKKITETNRRFAELLQAKDSYRDSIKSVITTHLEKIDKIDSELPKSSEFKTDETEIHKETPHSAITNQEIASPQENDSQSKSTVTENESNTGDSVSKDSASVGNNDSNASGPRPGDDGIIVFGRKNDREKSPEENAKILREIDSVVDKFASDLTR